MPRETNLLRVKLVAHTLLDVQIQETALSPVIVSHPFTNSGISALRNEDGSLSMVDLINNSDDCTSCLLYTSPSPRDSQLSRMPSSA